MPALLAGASAALAGAGDPQPPGWVGFSLSIRGIESRLATISHTVAPGETLVVRVDTGGAPAAFVRGEARALGGGRWRLRAPEEPGVRHLAWRHGDETMTLHLLVVRPLEGTGTRTLNGYRIGRYASEPLRGLAVYEPPPGLIEVTEDMLDLPVSTHFRLGDFLCKQPGGFPRYLLLRTELLLKLENLLARARAAGLAREPFTIMSGYRTPGYNRAIGNRTIYSRHLYGGAADVFVDESPRDGRMDDLNGDGRVDLADAGELYRLVAEHDADPAHAGLAGGLARYPANHVHGPFVHLDTRGWTARWGR